MRSGRDDVAGIGDVCGTGDGTALLGDVALWCIDAHAPRVNAANTNAANINDAVRAARARRVIVFIAMVSTTVACGR